MSEVGVRLSYEETPVFFRSGDDDLFGIVTRPREGGGRTAMVLLPGGGTPLNTNRNRLTVRMCRELAALGYTAMRMDYHGTGESAGSTDRFHLGFPFVPDVSAGIELLKDGGVEKIVMVGLTCFGARTAIATAAEREDVEAVVAMAAPIRDFAMGEGHSLKAARRKSLVRYVIEAFRPRTIRGVFNQRNRKIYGKHARAKARMIRARVSAVLPWTKSAPVGTDRVSPKLIRALQRLTEREIPVLLVYGDDEDYYREFVAAKDEGELARVLAEGASLIRVATVPGKVHGLGRLAVQDAVTELLLEWAADWRDGSSRPSSAGDA